MKIIVSIAGLLLVTSAGAMAQEATLAAIQGSVKIRHLHKRDYSKAKKGDTLAFGEWLATEPKSIAHLEFKGDKAVLIRENSIVKLEGKENQVKLNFTFGEFLVGVKGKLAKKQSFEVITPAADAAVRGTLFWGKTDLDKTATFTSFGNTVQVTSQGKTVSLTPGQTVSIRLGDAPQEPKPSDTPASYLNNFAVDGSIEKLDLLLDKSLRPPK